MVGEDQVGGKMSGCFLQNAVTIQGAHSNGRAPQEISTLLGRLFLIGSVIAHAGAVTENKVANA